MKGSYIVDRNLLDEFVNGLKQGKYEYYQFYDTHDVLANNWWDIQQRFKFSQKPKQLPLMFFDIEVDAEDGIFPDPPIARWPVNAIATMHSVTKTVTLFFIPPKKSSNHNWEEEIKKLFFETVKQHPEYTVDGISFEFKQFKNDEILLKEFWLHVRDAAVVALVGFNSNIFDIPYLVNRTKKIYKNDYKNIISESGDLKKFGEKFEIPDYSFIDLLHLYKPQSAGGMSFGKALVNYSLESVSREELKIGKLDYEGSLVELYNNDPVRFFTYNIFDTVLLYLLNKRLKHIDVLKGLAQFTNTPFSKALVGRSLLYQYDKLFQYWQKGRAVCSKLYNEEISRVR